MICSKRQVPGVCFGTAWGCPCYVVQTFSSGLLCGLHLRLEAARSRFYDHVYHSRLIQPSHLCLGMQHSIKSPPWRSGIGLKYATVMREKQSFGNRINTGRVFRLGRFRPLWNLLSAPLLWGGVCLSRHRINNHPCQCFLVETRICSQVSL